ncbi:hypothetical protein PSAB6_110155 [Paraburkholderia sabiae]|nr:hypothetical protein PSAB6_110155 [Paraburkholderia sabiae]
MAHATHGQPPERCVPSPAWENSLWTALFLLNDFFELRFSTFVIYLTLQHTSQKRTGRMPAHQNPRPPPI